jgi:hypothetical protein
MRIRIETNLLSGLRQLSLFIFFSSHRLNIDSRCGAAETTVIVRYSFKILKSQSVEDFLSSRMCTTFFYHLLLDFFIVKSALSLMWGI